MSSRIISRLSRARHGLIRQRAALLPLRQDQLLCSTFGVEAFKDAGEGPSAKWVPSLIIAPGQFQRLGFCSSASPRPNGRETSQQSDEQPNDTQSEANTEAKDTSDAEEDDLSIDDLVKLVAEKEELLKTKHKEIEKMQDKVLRSYAEMENVIDRTKREAENSKKFAIQNFAKSLLDVADNLGRASSVVKESFSKLESSKDPSAAVSLLKTLLEGVEMTDKQLSEAFKKFGVEKFDPTNEHFDPHRHHALFQIPDASKEPGTVAVVLKTGYMLYDRVIRPAEVGVIEAVDDANQSSDA